MKKIDATVLKETKYIACSILLLSILMQAIFLIIGKWDYRVLLGNFLSGGAGILNFFIMGITVQNALLKEEKDAKNAIKISQLYRNFFIAVILIIGLTVPCFNKVTTIIPLFFTRIAIAFRPLLDKKEQN